MTTKTQSGKRGKGIPSSTRQSPGSCRKSRYSGSSQARLVWFLIGSIEPQV